MNKSIVIGAIVVVVALIVVYVIKSNPAGGSALGLATQSSTTPPQMITSGTKFSDLPDAQFAYKVFPGPLDANSQAALTGWNIASVSMPDGSETVTLTPKNAEDQKHVYTVTPGSGLYFVEKSTGDDNAQTGTDRTFADDYGVLVDANGIVQ